MKTEQILNLDFRKEENKEIIQKVLRKIKPLSKCSVEEDIPLEKIEKVVKVLSNKYEITPQWVNMSYRSNECNVYSVGVKTTTDHSWLGNVYGMCLYELFAKLAIKMYSEIRSGNIPERTLNDQEKKRERLAKKADQKLAKGKDD